jgi:hypothetical protein
MIFTKSKERGGGHDAGQAVIVPAPSPTEGPVA